MIAAPDDTIAAIATPPGKGGVGIVRLSGREVPAIVLALFGCPLTPRLAHYRSFRDADGSIIDSGLALYFPAPASYTGEDVLELHAHGGPVLLDMLLRRLLCSGARAAGPGEFTQRAFLNGKIDLAQAEAVADLIDSATEQAARSAQRSLCGEFSSRIHELVERVIRLRTYIEAAIDFTDDEIDFLSEGAVAGQLTELGEALNRVTASARQGSLLREGMRVVIAGHPNVGKSSLLNGLAGRESAIVTAIPGTTRDLLREHIQVDGMPLHIIDTAGLRETEDPVEREGIRRARDAMADADRVLLVVDAAAPDASEEILRELPAGPVVTRIRNKIDLLAEQPRIDTAPNGITIHLSAATGAGLDLLRGHLKDCVGYHGDAGGLFIARRRHLDALAHARRAVDAAQVQTTAGRAELIAEELREAQQALGEITGEFTTEDLLSRIFGSFCIGK